VRRTLLIGLALGAVLAGGVTAILLTAGRNEPAADQGPPVIQPGAPGQPGRPLSADDLARMSAPPAIQADVDFVAGMIAHHGQALQMTALVPGRAQAPQITTLAERITVTQTDEIAQMQHWLVDQGLPPLASHGGHPVGMPGMLTDDQFAQLSAARGGNFDRLFLELMIRHHEGAVTMANRLYTAGGGQEPASDRFARDVIADQNIEIARMRTLLASLPA
jgi:uncharacterized protein (DUF305 family)